MHRASLLVVGAALFAACGPYPVPVDEPPPRRMPAADPHAGHDHAPGEGHEHEEPAASRQMPADAVHAPFAGANPAGGASVEQPNPHGGPTAEGDVFAGVVRLPGDAATWTEGYLFVSVVPAGTNSPACFDRLDLANAREDSLIDGVRVVPFRYESCPAPPGDLELKVQLDGDGFVETKEEGGRIGRFPIERGDEAIDVTLEG